MSTRTRTKTAFNNINTPSASFNNYNKLLFGYRCNGIEKMIIGEVLMPLHFNYYYYCYYCLIDDISYVSYDVLQSGAF
ncbi:MAG: hypothetical protein WA421_10355 [Nitrososphaeraceae archaeon]